MSPIIQSLPVLVLYPHSRCNCRCLMCDIWKNSATAELSSEDLEKHLADIEKLSVRWVVLSGGEPLMHSDLFRLSSLLRSRGIRVTLLSTGLLLERNAQRVVRDIDDVIVSLDGPPAVHDLIRRIRGAFALLERGVRAIHEVDPAFPISARCTVQRENHFCIRQTAKAARRLALKSISFLAADVISEAFNRPNKWTEEHQAQIALTEPEVVVLERELDALFYEWAGTGFVVESREKLRRIVLHYRAHLGLCEPESPQCNAPWVSAVIETDGTVRPCFFHRPIGSVKTASLHQVLNGPNAVDFRLSLDVSTDLTCRRCVCSLNWR